MKRGAPRLLAAWAILVHACVSAANPAHAAQGSAAVGAAAPAFSRKDLAGKEVDLAALHGNVILLNFWATWCSPCLSEVPRFAQWQQTYRAKGLRIVGISMDDDEAPVRATYAKFQLNYAVAMGDVKLAEAYGGVLGLPLTLLIDRTGTIRFRHGGASDLNQIEHEIRALLEEPE
jgi:peroxiredoxin